MKVYCIIVTYNGSQWVEKCFSSLYSSDIHLNIIAIDNASSDNTADLIKKNFPTVNVIETDHNLGFGQANNIGLKIALKENADYVFLLNQDTWIQSSTIKKLVNVLSQNMEYGIAAPFQLNYEGTGIEKYFNDYVIGQYTAAYISDFYNKNLKGIYPSQFIHAAGWLIPIKVVRDIGGFDPLFSHYGEDNDYVQRLQANKYLIGFVPEAIMYHYGSNDGLSNPASSRVFKTNSSLIRFKNMNGGMMGNTLVFLKSSFDAFTSALIYRKFKMLKVELAVFYKVLLQIAKISASRKIQKKKYAYLK